MLDEPSDPFRLTRGKVFLWGTSVTLILCGLVFLYVPSAPKGALNVVQEPGSQVSATTLRTISPQTTPEKYVRYCGQCHGEDGRGNTRMAEMMAVKPSNLADGPYRYGRTVDDVKSIIANGGGAMPGFGAELGEDGVSAVAAYVLEFAKNPAK